MYTVFSQLWKLLCFFAGHIIYQKLELVGTSVFFIVLWRLLENVEVKEIKTQYQQRKYLWEKWHICVIYSSVYLSVSHASFIHNI